MPSQTTRYPLTIESLKALCAEKGLPGAVVKPYGFGNDNYAKVSLCAGRYEAAVRLTDGGIYPHGPGLLDMKSIETWLGEYRAMFAQAMGL